MCDIRTASQVSAVTAVSQNVLNSSWAYLIDLFIISSSFASSVLLNVHCKLSLMNSIRFLFIFPVVHVIFLDFLTVVRVVVAVAVIGEH
jgi:hypothetical protein